MANIAVPLEEFGVLFLGIFVGGVLSYGLTKTDEKLKGAITVIGAALGGGPILFMTDMGAAKWTYPIGLVIGLLTIRLAEARKEVHPANEYLDRCK